MAGLVDMQPLLERETELARIGALIEGVATGSGAVVCIEGPAGIGKTRLVGEAAAIGTGSGLRVLVARGGELEREFAYGVVRQLLEPSVEGPHRRRLLAGAARHATAALALDPAAGTRGSDRDAGMAALHGLYWVCVNLCELHPVLVVVDDAHWADEPSLRFLEYLSGRLDGLRLGLVVAARPSEPHADPALLARLVTRPGAELLRPRALSHVAVAELVAAVLGEDGDEAFVAACREMTGGTPFLVSELLRTCAEDGIAPRTPAAAGLAKVVPATVTHATLLRLGRLPEHAADVARAVAVLGAEASVRHVASLTGHEEDRVLEAADLLSATHVLSRGRPLSFAHALVRTAVYEDIPRVRRERLHRAAAELLRAERATAERTAVHLLAVEPRSDVEVVQALQEAAERASARGGPEVAAACLRRALAEPPPPALRPRLLLELGIAEACAGDQRAAVHLEQALESAEDEPVRVVAAVTLGRTLLISDQRHESIEAFERARATLASADDAVQMLFEAAVTGAAMLDSAAAPLVAERLDRLDRLVSERESVPVNVLAVLAMRAAFTNRPADDAVALAERALAGGGPLADAAVRAPYLHHACAALLFAERYGILRPRYEAALVAARDAGSAQQFSAVSCFLSWLELRSGDVAAAEAHARAALDAETLHDQRLFRPMILGKVIRALTEQGRLDAAGAELERSVPEERTSLHYALFLHDRGVVKREQGRHDEALADLLDAGERLTRLGATSPGVVPWRSDAALTQLSLGRRDEARALAAEELELARAFGAPGAIGIALRAAGLARPGAQGIECLHEAVATLERSSAKLEHVRALTDLGAALRRAGRRAEARQPLRAALDGALRYGATALAQRAETELRATGARPRRLVLTGLDALTPSERRIAAMAAEGLTNREIAQALFVTPRTVEGHLTHVYRKLDVDSRDRLSAALT